MQPCSSDFVNGIRAQVLSYQGPFTDDVAVQDFEIQCNNGVETIDVLPGRPVWNETSRSVSIVLKLN